MWNTSTGSVSICIPLIARRIITIATVLKRGCRGGRISWRGTSIYITAGTNVQQSFDGCVGTTHIYAPVYLYIGQRKCSAGIHTTVRDEPDRTCRCSGS